MVTPKKLALQAFWAVESAAARQLMLDQADERIRGRLTALLALEQRLTQAASILLAASAIAATLAANEQAAFLARVSAAGAGALFACGGVVAFHGMRARTLMMPGVSPAHWAQGEVGDFTEKGAQWRVFGLAQETLDGMDAEAGLRAAALNRGVGFGVAGGLLAAVAGILALL